MQNLVFDKTDLRLQMEREIKGKWLLTRLSVLEQSPKPKVLAATLQLSIRAILPVLKGICYLADRPIPQETDQLIAQAEQVCQTELGLLNTWLQARTAVRQNIQSYLDILQALMLHIENLNT